MKVVSRGIVNAGVVGTPRAISTFSAFLVLADGTWLATYRVGTSKDCDDEVVEFRRSNDEGQTWSEPETPLPAPVIDGARGSIRCAYCTELAPDHLIVAAMWIDHSTFPGKPLFNEETEGCLPMKLLVAESDDNGYTWSELREVPMPEDVGPPSLTNPIMRLASGRLVLCIETNKTYNDDSTWYQRVVFCYSDDGGKSWSEPVTTSQDPTARIFYWDQRAGVWPDGKIATFSWTYDRETTKYLNIQRKISADEGQTWTEPEDLGFTDQAAHPAILPDGSVVLAYVDRFQSRSIRARLAPSIDGAFSSDTEVVLYQHQQAATLAQGEGDTGELLVEMGLWTFGLPYAAALPNGDAVVVYYQGSNECMDIHWARVTTG